MKGNTAHHHDHFQNNNTNSNTNNSNRKKKRVMTRKRRILAWNVVCVLLCSHLWKSSSSRSRTANSNHTSEGMVSAVVAAASFRSNRHPSSAGSSSSSSSSTTTTAGGSASRGKELERVWHYPRAAYWHTHDSEEHHAPTPAHTPTHTHNTHRKDLRKEDVIVVTTVDGTMAGLCIRTGVVLWKQKQAGQRLYDPLVKTTTHLQSTSTGASSSANTNTNNNNNGNNNGNGNAGSSSPMAAVPSLDGHVYLTPAAAGASTSASRPQSATEMTTVRQLVTNAPFVDAQGRFYVGSRTASAAALDVRHGHILHMVHQPSPAADPPPNHHNNNHHDAPEGDHVVWLGRVDYSVSIYHTATGSMDVQFGTSELLSVEDMVPLSFLHEPTTPTATTTTAAAAAAAANSQPSNSNLNHNHNDNNNAILMLKSQPYHDTDDLLFMDDSDDFIIQDGDDEEDDEEEEESSRKDCLHSSLPCHTTDTNANAASSNNNNDTYRYVMQVTPSGTIALKELSTNTIRWVQTARTTSLSTPVAFALQSDTGSTIPVQILPDPPLHHNHHPHPPTTTNSPNE